MLHYECSATLRCQAWGFCPANPDQRSIIGTLQSLPALSVAHKVSPPALIMVGETVSLQARIGSSATLVASPLMAA